MHDSTSVASIILQQLGGSRFKAMTGASSFLAFDQGLSFKIPSRTVTHVHIYLEPGDTYAVSFSRLRAGRITIVSMNHGIYADQLQSLFTRVTGLDTHL